MLLEDFLVCLRCLEAGSCVIFAGARAVQFIGQPAPEVYRKHCFGVGFLLREEWLWLWKVLGKLQDARNDLLACLLSSPGGVKERHFDVCSYRACHVVPV